MTTRCRNLGNAILSGRFILNIKAKFVPDHFKKRSRSFSKMIGNVFENDRDDFFDRLRAFFYAILSVGFDRIYPFISPI